MTTVHVIANPVAGGGRGAVVARTLVPALESAGLSASLFLTAQAGDARAEAGRARADVFAVVGGDGTLNEVLNGLPARTDTHLAVLPVGTANVVARQLGMQPDAAFVAAAIAGGQAVPMDLGLHGDRRFLLGAGAGVDAAVTRVVQEGRGTKSSLWRWVGPAMGVLWRYAYPKITVSVDGAVLCEAADYVIIGNCRNSAGIFPATPRAQISDGLLDVCAISGLNLPRIVWLMANVWRPGFVDRSWIDYRQGKMIDLVPRDSGQTVYLQIDGDPAGTLPATFTVADWPVRMVVPDVRGAG